MDARRQDPAGQDGAGGPRSARRPRRPCPPDHASRTARAGPAPAAPTRRATCSGPARRRPVRVLRHLAARARRRAHRARSRRLGKPASSPASARRPAARTCSSSDSRAPYSYLRRLRPLPPRGRGLGCAASRSSTVASLPLAEQVPIDGVPTGPRGHGWRPTEPATLSGPRRSTAATRARRSPHRDRLMHEADRRHARSSCARPSTASPASNGLRAAAWRSCRQFDRDRRWTAPFLVTGRRRGAAGAPAGLGPERRRALRRPGQSRSCRRPAQRRSGSCAGTTDCDLLAGQGASPRGDRPFLDRLDLDRWTSRAAVPRATTARSRRSSALRRPGGGTFLTRRESPTDPPNLLLRTLGAAVRTRCQRGRAASTSTARRSRASPTRRRRSAASPSSWSRTSAPTACRCRSRCTCRPDYKPGTRLPTVVWAYPLDYTDPARPGRSAARRTSSPPSTGRRSLFFAAAGYAVLDDVAMPVVGPPETVYDTFVEQIVANAKAAIDKAVELGVTDPRSRRRGRAQPRRAHDREPARPLRPVPGRRRAQRRVQPHAAAVRVPERAPHAVGGARRVHSSCRR